MQKLKISEYIAGMEGATSAPELEAAIQAPCNFKYHGPTWSRICKVRIARGQAICEASPLGRFVPKLGERRDLTVCGEHYKVGRGGDSYAWHAASRFAMETLKKHGLSQRAAYAIWDSWSSYPHRCLAIVEKALAGNMPDPELDTLKFASGGNPIKYTVAQNDADEIDRRATMACIGCKTGVLFDWGAGFSSGFTFVSWHCNACGNSYTEYTSPKRFEAIRRPAWGVEAPETAAA